MRIVTPGTLTDESLLDASGDSLIVSVYRQQMNCGVAWMDVSSGRFLVSEMAGEEALAAELQRLSPAEVLVAEDATLPALGDHVAVRRLAAWQFDEESARRRSTSSFKPVT